MMRVLLFCLVVAGAMVGSLPSQEKTEKYARGRKAPTEEQLKKYHAEAFKRHGHRFKSLPTATPAKFDCADFGWVTPIKNQASCGSCYIFSACGVSEMAFVKAGKKPKDGSFGLSEQFFLDCERGFGACGGGFEAEVVDYIKKNGAPSEQDYGPYQARSNACKQFATRYKIDDWGYCTPSQQSGIASTQDIKNAMVQYGPISVAAAAGASWDNPNGVLTDKNRGVNHAIMLTGWDDTKGSKGAWKLRNSWGTNWAEGGYVWIEYGADEVGTEALWAHVTTIDPVPPDPPGPVPPGPVVGGTITFDSAFQAGKYKVVPEDAIVIHGNMTLKEFADALSKAGKQLPSPCDANADRIRTLEATIQRLEKALGTPK